MNNKNESNYFSRWFRNRLSEYTKTIPKPMIKINKLHSTSYFKDICKYGFRTFYIAAGYKKN